MRTRVKSVGVVVAILREVIDQIRTVEVLSVVLVAIERARVRAGTRHIAVEFVIDPAGLAAHICGVPDNLSLERREINLRIILRRHNIVRAVRQRQRLTSRTNYGNTPQLRPIYQEHGIANE